MTGAEDLRVRRGLVIPAGELRESASRAGGPGGQHVNKSNTRVTLRWSLRDSAAPSDAIRRRLERNLGHRLTRAGEVIVHAARHRSRARNRALARERLAELLSDAMRTRTPRVPTAPTQGSRRRALDAKRRRGAIKRVRGRVRGDDDA